MDCSLVRTLVRRYVSGAGEGTVGGDGDTGATTGSLAGGPGTADECPTGFRGVLRVPAPRPDRGGSVWPQEALLWRPGGAGSRVKFGLFSRKSPAGAGGPQPRPSRDMCSPGGDPRWPAGQGPGTDLEGVCRGQGTPQLQVPATVPSKSQVWPGPFGQLGTCPLLWGPPEPLYPGPGVGAPGVLSRKCQPLGWPGVRPQGE